MSKDTIGRRYVERILRVFILTVKLSGETSICKTEKEMDNIKIDLRKIDWSIGGDESGSGSCSMEYPQFYIFLAIFYIKFIYLFIFISPGCDLIMIAPTIIIIIIIIIITI
jgi:hypothetical protein